MIELFENQTGFQIFCDLDGVLVDFTSGIEKLMAQVKPKDRKPNDYWRVLHSLSYEEAEDWWANLDWINGGKELWSFIGKFNPIILSKPDARPGFRQACEKGKMRWINKNLHPKPAHTILSTDKWKHAGKFSILIDDLNKNLVPWEEHGGAGIYYETGNPKKAIKELIERFGFPRK